MKKLLIYSTLMAILVINSGAGCGSSSTPVDPQPDGFQSLVGKWQAQRATYEITEQNGNYFETGPDFIKNGVTIIWEFFSDGRLKATQDGKTREVRWKLNVTQLSGQSIDKGTLTIIGDEERALAQLIGQPGDLTYNIVAGAPSNGNFATMFLSVDATKQGPYKKNILRYTYYKL
ncbi:hypothetical protein ACAW74_24225 [Fibrella sp. WM1]|uniref:hypothetical protein n=1 Tax=Fibrella musci TaxID=3242485 RepID=UPI0035202D35